MFSMLNMKMDCRKFFSLFFAWYYFYPVMIANEAFICYHFSVADWVKKVINEHRDVLELMAAIKYESFTHTKLGKKIKGGFSIKSNFPSIPFLTYSKSYILLHRDSSAILKIIKIFLHCRHF